MSWCVLLQTPSQKFTSNEAPSAVLLKKMTSSLKRYNYTKRVTKQSVAISQTLFKQAEDVVMLAIADAIAEVHQQRSTKCSAPEETDVIAQKVKLYKACNYTKRNYFTNFVQAGTGCRDACDRRRHCRSSPATKHQVQCSWRNWHHRSKGITRQSV